MIIEILIPVILIVAAIEYTIYFINGDQETK